MDIPARRTARSRFGSVALPPWLGGGGSAPGAHTHLEVDITDLGSYLPLGGGTMSGNLILGAGSTLAVKDSTDADSATWSHDGTHLKLVLAGTTDYKITGLSGGVLSIDGNMLMTSAAPLIGWVESDEVTDEKRWDLQISAAIMSWRMISDDFGTINTFIQATRTGVAISALDFTATDASFSGTLKCGKFGANATTPITKPTVTGSRGGNAALASLLTALANYGLITDSSS